MSNPKNQFQMYQNRTRKLISIQIMFESHNLYPDPNFKFQYPESDQFPSLDLSFEPLA